MYPTDRQYSKEHEWILIERDSGAIGITDFAQNELGDIVFVELPEVGKQFQRGEVLGTIESVKAVSEIYAPVGGSVMEVNEALNDNPEVINQDPHGDGWLCKLKIADAAELTELMDAAAYEELAGQ